VRGRSQLDEPTFVMSNSSVPRGLDHRHDALTAMGTRSGVDRVRVRPRGAGHACQFDHGEIVNPMLPRPRFEVKMMMDPRRPPRPASRRLQALHTYYTLRPSNTRVPRLVSLCNMWSCKRNEIA
jgi:hypothetical protein